MLSFHRLDRLQNIENNMEGVNLLCETFNCGKPAVAFGIKETLKIRSCDEHITSLVSKKLQICDIMGYPFISSLYDAAEFEERKTLVDKGRGNATVLEMNCESELQAALQAIDCAKYSAIESIEQRFEEMKAEVIETCNEIKNQFAEIQRNFAQFLDSKENQLSPTAQLICGKLSVIPQFLRFGISDVSSHISAVLSTCWFIPTADIHSTLKCLDDSLKKVAIESVLAEATECARKGIHNALCYVELLSGEEEFGQSQLQVLEEILKFEKTRIDENLKWLQHAWGLRQRCGLSECATVKVGRSLAALLCHQFGQFAPAEQILRLCYQVTQAESPLSEDSMTLCTDICGIYVANAQFQQAEEIGLWVLQIFEAAGLPSECYWTALFYLTESMRQLGKRGEVTAILERWGNLKVSNKLSEMLQLLIYGSGVYETENKEEEAKWLLQARSIGASHFPTSTFTALVCFRLALVSNDSTREELHKLARSIYEIAAPSTFYATMNLTNLGEILQKKDQYSLAEECYRQAKSIYEIAAPNSIYAAVNLTKMGVFLGKKEQYDEAIVCHHQARGIYVVVSPQSTEAADNLSELAEQLEKKEKWDEAEWYFKQAQSIYEVTAPKSIDAAKILERIAWFYNSKKCREAAEMYFKQAQSLYVEVAPKSIDAANNLKRIAWFYVSSDCWEEAEKYFKQAQSLYEEVAPKSIDVAKNLGDLAWFYAFRERWEVAEEFYRQARSIFEEVAPKSVDFAVFLCRMGGLYKDKVQWNQAEEFYLQARSIYEEVAPKSVDFAAFLHDMGEKYKNKGQWNQAEKFYLQARSIYEEVAPKSGGLARVLRSTGDMYKAREQWNQAEEFYKLSLSIYEEIDPQSWDAGIVHYDLGEVYKAMNKNEQALECLRKSVPLFESENLSYMKKSAEELIAQLLKSAK